MSAHCALMPTHASASYASESSLSLSSLLRQCTNSRHMFTRTALTMNASCDRRFNQWQSMQLRGTAVTLSPMAAAQTGAADAGGHFLKLCGGLCLLFMPLYMLLMPRAPKLLQQVWAYRQVRRGDILVHQTNRRTCAFQGFRVLTFVEEASRII